MREKHTLDERGFAPCQHIKVDGIQCGSPALTHRDYCYWHDAMRRRTRTLDLPTLEDPKSVLVAANRIMQAMADGRTDTRTACGLLYGLQLVRDHMRASAEPKSKAELRDEHDESAYLDFLAEVEPGRLLAHLAKADRKRIAHGIEPVLTNAAREPIASGQ